MSAVLRQNAITDMAGVALDVGCRFDAETNVPECFLSLYVDHAELIGRHVVRGVEFEPVEFELEFSIGELSWKDRHCDRIGHSA